MSDTLTITEIAELMHVSPKTARDKKVTAHDFPKPVFKLSQRNRAWRRADVLAYLNLTDVPQSAPESPCSTPSEAD